MDDEYVKFSLRLPEHLKKRLEKRAKKNRRSLNAEIEILLERFIEAEEYTIMDTQPVKKGDNGEEHAI